MAANVNVQLVKFEHFTSLYTSNQCVPKSTPIGTGQTIPTGGSSAQTTLTATAAVLGTTPVNQVAWRVTASGALSDAVYVTFGANPTATDAGFMVPVGTVCYFGVSAVDEKAAVLGPA